jgi:hypothetical protein
MKRKTLNNKKKDPENPDFECGASSASSRHYCRIILEKLKATGTLA